MIYHKLKDTFSKEKLIKLNKKFTVRKIAKMYNVDKAAITYWMKKFNLYPLKRWERYPLSLNENQMQIVLGGLLGDACIPAILLNQRNYRLEMGQKLQDLKYLKYKHKILKPFSKPLKVSKPRNFANFNTVSHPIFTNLRSIFYPKGKKIIPQIVFDKLNLLGLAIWFMDDGSYSRNRVRIATCDFNQISLNLAIQLFKERWDLTPKITNYRYPYLEFSSQNSRRLIAMIRHLVLSRMPRKV